MKHWLVTIAALLGSLTASAFSFEVDAIFYCNIISDTDQTVEVRVINKDVTSITIPSTVTYKGITYRVTSIENDAFFNCTSLTSITIPESVTSIGEGSFSGCSGLTSITIPESVTSIGSFAFYRCSGLTSITIPESVTSIGDYAFEYCSRLTSIILPESVTSIGEGSFSGCSGLTAITIPEGVTSIDYAAFDECSGLTSISIPSSVTSIKNDAFSGCSSLEEVTFHCANVDSWFSGIKTIKQFVLGEEVTNIGGGAFQYCEGLTSITVPEGVTSIGDMAFTGCTQLTNFIVEDRSTELNLGKNGSSGLFSDCPLDSVYIGGKLTYNVKRGHSPFYRNASLRSVVISDREEQIYDKEFTDCANLHYVAIGHGVKSIGEKAFSGCSSLKSLSFGSGVETIGEEAFSDCTGLTSITSYATVPPVCDEGALDGIDKQNCTLHIPEGSLAAYQAADQWKEFLLIEDDVTAGIEDVIVGGKQAEAVYDLNGRRVPNADNLKGIYIVGGKKVVVK